MMKDIIFLIPDCSATIKLWLRRTLVLPYHYAASRAIEPHGLERAQGKFFVLLPAFVTSWLNKKNASKTILFHSLLLLFSFQLFAQDIDTTYTTSYYQQKVSQFRLLPNTKGEIIFLGNSITDIGEWAELWNNNNVKNRGISGDNTFGVLARLDEVVSSKPAKIFILIGINDIAKGTPDSVIVSNYKKIIRRIQTSSPQTMIYVQSILPTNNEFTEFVQHQNKDEHIQAVNNKLKQLCGQNRLVYVELYSRFLESPGKMNKRYTNDGLHLTGEGFMLWKKVLKDKGYMK